MPGEPTSIASVNLPKKQYRTVMLAVDHWRRAGVIDGPTQLRLANSIAIALFNWQLAARYAFLAALVCVVILVGALWPTGS